MAMSSAHPRGKEAHPRRLQKNESPNKSGGLFLSIHEVVGVNNSDNVFELCRPILTRCSVPVQMFGFLEDANIALFLRNQPNNISHTIQRILRHLLPSSIPPNPQIHTRLLHPCRISQPRPNILLLHLRTLEPILPPINPLLICRTLHPWKHQRNAPSDFFPPSQKVGRPKKGIDRRSGHPGEGGRGDYPDIFRFVGNVGVGHDGFSGCDGTGLW
mmetsp:Transcript_10646/g.20708  ORF Transcript_10646/g.20708 Transcript_10646/m.20708 type:complete len:215 (-) Transcript_10646:1180-1824(-)